MEKKSHQHLINLRELMKKHKIDAYYFSTKDLHNNTLLPEWE